MAEMLARLERSETRRRSPAVRSDDALMARCGQLSAKYLHGEARPSTVRWVPPMRTRWASCTPAEGSIRVSRQLQQMPSWVLDYVLVHELAHLIAEGHSAEFWALVHAYPKTDRAIGYLEGFSAAGGLAMTED